MTSDELAEIIKTLPPIVRVSYYCPRGQAYLFKAGFVPGVERDEIHIDPITARQIGVKDGDPLPQRKDHQ